MKEKSKTVKKTKTGKSKNTTRKKVKAKNSEKDELVKELRSIIKDIDVQGLKFLIKQANVLIYNKKVDEYNAEISKLGTKITSVKKPPFSDKISMEIKEADDGSSFIFVINRARKFFTLSEMRKIVKVCHLAKDETTGSQRLFTWFKNNRGDVLNDIGIERSNDPALATIYNHIIQRYAVKNS